MAPFYLLLSGEYSLPFFPGADIIRVLQDESR